MPKIFNEDNLKYNFHDAPLPEFTWHESQNLAEVTKSERLHFNVKSLDVNKYSYPYHYHRNAEEMMVILSGKATLRSPEGFREVKKGDIIFFEKGPDGVHQLYNHTDEPCKYLDIRTKADLDICDYPDSGKINILPNREMYMKDTAVGCFDNEENVKDKWKDFLK